MKFGKKDPVKEQEKKNIEENAKKASNDAIGHAQNCLRDPEFQKYKEAYERMGKALFQELIDIDMMTLDPIIYGFQCKSVVSKYRHIGSLLRAVEGEAGKHGN